VKTTVIALAAVLAARASCHEPPHTETARTTDPDESSSPPPASTGQASGGESPAPSSDGTHHDAPREIAARHLLVMYRGSMRNSGQTRTREEARARAADALRRARAGEDFPALVREFSDEPGAGARGGALGRFGHGMMTPAFERAAFALEVGQFSDVVETEFGFHVIQRTE
jgi:hypothetical protein